MIHSRQTADRQERQHCQRREQRKDHRLARWVEPKTSHSLSCSHDSSLMPCKPSSIIPVPGSRTLSLVACAPKTREQSDRPAENDLGSATELLDSRMTS